MSRALCRRIFEHAIAEGWLRLGDVVVDPFGGIGSTGIVGAEAGLQVVMCELEPRFVELNQANIEKHRWRWQQFGRPIPRVVQGDSRRLREVLAAADCVVSSPPYEPDRFNTRNGIDLSKLANGQRPAGWNSQARSTEDYGATPGQLANMAVGSPPFITQSGGRGQMESGPLADDGLHDRHAAGKRGTDGYGASAGLMGEMREGDVAAVVGSPPFEAGNACNDPNYTTGRTAAGGPLHGDYGATDGQLGNDTGETFWSAAKEILQQCHQILKPGGHAIWVCKDFVRKGKRVPFSDDWLRLCEAVGFVFVCRHRAMLVAETVDAGLFGTVTKKRERKSFFRRLAEKKGSPPIDYEDVICVQKPELT